MSTLPNASPGPNTRRRKTSSAPARAVLVERRVATPRADLLLIKIGDRYKKEAVSPKEKASGVLARLGRVMSKPGTDPRRVFKSTSGRPVYAYSIDTQDTSKVVREDATGQRTVGRLVSGKFRAARAV